MDGELTVCTVYSTINFENKIDFKNVKFVIANFQNTHICKQF